MDIVLFIVFGFIVGLLARALLPGDQKMGFLWTTGLGIAGSLAGGVVSSLISGHRVLDFHSAGLVGSVIGAIVLLAIYGLITRRYRRAIA